MKKIYLFILLSVSVLMQAQKHTDRYYNSWRLGLNMGAMWQIADVRSTAGFAGGFTLEKGIAENKTHFFSLAIKGRGLWGNTYGLDYVRNYDIKNNPALNGTYNPQTNYDTIMPGIAPFVYNNYKTKIAEGALELQICFNRLRERTNILLNLWGGIGFTSYRTSVNLLDDKNKRYNYNLVDSIGSKALTLSSHGFLLDDSYESYGMGKSKSGNVLTLSPSCGIGFGYRFNDYISILWEHKITFPQGTYSDYLDGIKASNNDWLGCVKDYYHYSSLSLSIRMGGRKHTSTSNNVNNYTPANTNTVVTNTTVPTNSVSNTTVTKPVPPIVNITNPPNSPYTESTNRTFNIKADVYNVSQRNQLNVVFNGIAVNDYSWNGKTISFNAYLAIGNNNVSVSATNKAGSDSKSATIIYTGPPPQITITTPGANKVTTQLSIADVYATILNVSAQENISVLFNGQPFYSFGFNPTDKLYSANVNLTKGSNTMEITAINDFGKDFKSQIIIYNPTTVTSATATAPRPVKVTITDPAVNPYKSSGQNYTVKAKVTGVSAQSQVTVTANGVDVPFNFVGGNVDFYTTLNTGNNLMVVSASNGKSSDSKSTVITYEAPKKITPPTVVILKPQPSPETTSSVTYPFKAQTTNITNNTQLEVKFNGNAVSNYAFDATSGIIDYNGALTLNSNNFFEVKATNSHGSANASAIVKHETPVVKTKIICHKKADGSYETITINESDWASHQAHGDYEGTCKTKTNDPVDQQITICHKNADGSEQTIVIFQSTWAQHQAHGDVMGTCKTKTQTPIDIDPDITICHKNADGTETKLTIKQSQWASHQAHGDYIGGNCAANTNTANAKPPIEICHKNADGSSQTIVIPNDQWAQHRAHGDHIGKCVVTPTVTPEDKKITICHIPPGNNQNPQTIEINESAWPAHQAHGDTKGACPTPTVEPEDKKIIICHIPPGNNQNPQTIEINESAWPAHQAHGDTKGACPKIKNQDPIDIDPEITICHLPPGNTNNPQTITIKQSAWPAHQAHGDTKGVCPTPTVEPEDKKITICHIPPGNNQNPQTIEINESAWPAHQAHGDTKGACPTPTITPEDKKITICHLPPGNTNNPQTIEINESAWPAHQAHGDIKGTCPTPTIVPEDKKITICHLPPGNTNNPQTIEINESAWPAHLAHGDSKGVCPTQPTEPEDKKITICHLPPGNTNNPQTIEINESAWPAHQAHGDSKGVCPSPPKEPEDKKITICHLPPGNTNNPQTIEINESAWPAHLAHGDSKGVCPTPTVTPPADKKITICHIPPGKNQNPQTIEINESAWPAHQAHGDTKGACPEQKNIIQGGGKSNGKTEESKPENNGNNVPGRTNQTQTTEPSKTEETKKLTPR